MVRKTPDMSGEVYNDFSTSSNTCQFNRCFAKAASLTDGVFDKRATNCKGGMSIHCLMLATRRATKRHANPSATPAISTPRSSLSCASTGLRGQDGATRLELELLAWTCAE